MTRILKVNNLITEELGKIMLKTLDFEGVLTTITRVDASSNLQQAKVYISVMPEKDKGKILSYLKNNIYEVQQVLNKRLKMRPVPKIIFVTEEKTIKADRVEKLLNEIKDH